MNLSIMLLWSIVVQFLLFYPAQGVYGGFKFTKTLKNRKLSGFKHLFQSDVRSGGKCAMLCSGDKKCHSVNYHQENTECMLNFEVVGNNVEENLEVEDGWVYYEKSEDTEPIVAKTSSKFDYTGVAFRAKKNNLVHIIPFIGKEFTFEFNFTYFTTDSSVEYSCALLCTTFSAWTERYPAIWIMPGGLVQFEVSYDVEQTKPTKTLIAKNKVREPNQKYNMLVSSTYDSTSGKYKFIFKVDGVIETSTTVSDVPEFQNLKCYVGDPGHTPSYAVIEDFKFKPEGQ
ncbi:uncharacterized protein [Clytia hemisphaerica]|uniref:Apple domain-containing protein n=2 Tax=Clytia hemisphaerica TaxID=252671 RepID=A0A7M6DNM1_9CNID|eukprot:TCONS_00001391-protein